MTEPGIDYAAVFQALPVRWPCTPHDWPTPTRTRNSSGATDDTALVIVRM
ncbi:hypothetical protein [Streptomyces sp. 142MFCol3.1]|nr:hypothetical protein [Streptomyces sp. 142MFCol3.1]